MDYSITLNDLIKLVKEARPLVFDKGLANDVEANGANDFVTRADKAVQDFIKKRVSELYPDCRFMGEESKDHSIDKHLPTFVLDPIDGTTNFIHDFQLSAISLALVIAGESVLGVVYNPFTDDMYAAEKGKGATLNGKPIHVSETKTLDESIVMLGAMPYHKEVSGPLFPLYHEMFMKCVDIRRLGSAALEICYVAAGRAEFHFEAYLGPWDVAAAMLILREAGGTFSDWEGNEVDLYKEQLFVASSNTHMHKPMLDLIKKHRG